MGTGVGKPDGRISFQKSRRRRGIMLKFTVAKSVVYEYTGLISLWTSSGEKRWVLNLHKRWEMFRSLAKSICPRTNLVYVLQLGLQSASNPAIFNPLNTELNPICQ